jgi:transketolase
MVDERKRQDPLPGSTELRARARHIRRDILEMVWCAGSGHIGGSLSLVEILLVLYSRIMKVDPARPLWESRDRFVLSKGHGAACLYAVLSQQGFIDRQWLWTEFIRTQGRLPEHPDMRQVPGVDMSTGSLGQGFSAAVGMAWAARHRGERLKVYVVMGCGEQQEGQVWEAAMAASHHGLANLTAIIDLNSLQVSGPIAAVLNPNPLDEKYRSFGWEVHEVDGHDIDELTRSLDRSTTTSRPQLVIARTIKGKGISFMENEVRFHATSLAREQYEAAVGELGPLEETLSV